MKNKHPVAIITGANHGIGKEIAIGLAKMGFHTILIARDKNKLLQVAEEIIKINPKQPKPSIYSVNLNYSPEIEKTISEIINLFGRIDILVNNAGIYKPGTSKLSEEGLRAQLVTNLIAPFVLMKSVVPVMKKQGKGYIFNIASRSGKIGFEDSGGYSASKFGLVGISESFCRELSKSGISVTTICPGWVNTEMAVQANTPLASEEMIQPADIMHTIEWLLKLSPGVCIKEIILEPKKNII